MIQLIIGGIGIIASAGFIAYKTSDVWRTKIRKMGDGYAKWTPENIVKWPREYLDFCADEARKMMESLKASDIAIAQNKAGLDLKLATADKQIHYGAKALEELKTLYRAATAKGKAWKDIAWEGVTLDREAAKRHILSLDSQIKSVTVLKNTLEGAIGTMAAQTVKVHESMTDLTSQMAEIAVNREILNVNALSGQMAQKMSSIKGVLQSTAGVISKTGGIVTLETLAESRAERIDDSAFDAIMKA